MPQRLASWRSTRSHNTVRPNIGLQAAAQQSFKRPEIQTIDEGNRLLRKRRPTETADV